MILLKVHTGDGSETHRITDFPCSVGRALSNNIVLNHQSVSAKHAVIDRDVQGYFIEDVGSTNGIRQGKNKVTSVRIDKPVKISLGDIKMELRSSDEATENTAIIHFSEMPTDAKSSFGRPTMALFMVASALLINFLSSYFLEPDYLSSTFTRLQITTVLGVLAVAAVLSVWSKLQKGSYQFIALFTMSMFGMILLKFTEIFDEFFDFNLNSDYAYYTLDYTLAAVVLFYLFNGLAKIIFTEANKWKRRGIVTFILVAVLTVPYIARKFAEDRFDMVSLPLITSYSIRSFSPEHHNFENFEKAVLSINATLNKSREEQIKKNAELN